MRHRSRSRGRSRRRSPSRPAAANFPGGGFSALSGVALLRGLPALGRWRATAGPGWLPPSPGGREALWVRVWAGPLAIPLWDWQHLTPLAFANTAEALVGANHHVNGVSGQVSNSILDS